MFRGIVSSLMEGVFVVEFDLIRPVVIAFEAVIFGLGYDGSVLLGPIGKVRWIVFNLIFRVNRGNDVGILFLESRSNSKSRNIIFKVITSLKQWV